MEGREEEGVWSCERCDGEERRRVCGVVNSAMGKGGEGACKSHNLYK